MRRIVKVLIISSLVCLVSLSMGTKVYGDDAYETDSKDLLDSISYLEDIEHDLSEILVPGSDFSFRKLAGALLEGDLQTAGSMLLNGMREQLTGGLCENQGLLVKISILAVIGAVFTNFAMAFSKEEVAETGFMMAYTLLMTLLMTSFMMTTSIVRDVLMGILSFMKVLLPSFCLALTVSEGALMAGAYYEWMMLVITVADWFLAAVLLKMIQIYMLTELVNHLSKEDYLSKISELLRTVIAWSIKTVIAVVLGITMIQSMLMPAVDRAKNTLAYRLVSAVPGIGNAMNTAVGAMIGAGVLIRNVLGIGGLIVILFIGAAPIVRVCLVTLSYRVVQALIQPVSDKRLIEGIEAMIHGTSMMMQILIGCIMMLILSIAIVCNASAVIGY